MVVMVLAGISATILQASTTEVVAEVVATMVAKVRLVLLV
jgi:hypothetical protein